MSSEKKQLKGFGSTAIHAGHQTEGNYSHLTPIYASSTYVFDTAEQGMRRFSGDENGFIYGRWGNTAYVRRDSCTDPAARRSRSLRRS